MALILLIGFLFIVAGTLVCLIAVDGHPARPDYAFDAKLAISLLGAIVLAPLALVTFALAFLVIAPTLVAAPVVFSA